MIQNISIMRILVTPLLYSIILLSISCFTIGCSSDNEDDIVEISNPLSLQATSDYTILDNDNPNNEVLSFIWEKLPYALDEGTSLDGFLFKMDKGDNSFETAIPTTQIKNDRYYKSFTSKELNDLILNWGFVLGDEVALDVRVIAKFSNPNKFVKPYVSTIQVKVKTMEVVSTPLYLTGSAMPEGSDLDNAILLTEVITNAAYGWRGNMKAGEYIFPLTKESMYPAYAKGAGNTLILKESEESPGSPFTIHDDGYYAIYLNKFTKKISCEKVWNDQAAPLYIVGTATAVGGWEQSADRQMVWNYEYTHTCERDFDIFGSGSLRVSSWISGNNGMAFRPYAANSPISDGASYQVYFNNTPDFNWSVAADNKGRWKITLDTKNMTIKFNKIG